MQAVNLRVRGSFVPCASRPSLLALHLTGFFCPTLLFVDQVFTKLLLTSLPHELGQFILDSAAAASTTSCSNSSRGPTGEAAATGSAAAAVAAAGGAGVWLSGELCLTGPPLACLSACLTRSAEEVPTGRVSLTSFVQVSGHRGLLVPEHSLSCGMGRFRDCMPHYQRSLCAG
jgi:hypothetical protein